MYVILKANIDSCACTPNPIIRHLSSSEKLMISWIAVFGKIFEDTSK